MLGFVLKNGRVIDPSVDLNEIADVYVTEDGKIAAIEPEVDLKSGKAPEAARQQQDRWSPIDVTGCLVTPGLIDGHVHAYEYSTPLGINVDRTCLARGVTTVLDAGSAGNTFVCSAYHIVTDNAVVSVSIIIGTSHHFQTNRLGIIMTQ